MGGDATTLSSPTRDVRRRVYRRPGASLPAAGASAQLAAGAGRHGAAIRDVHVVSQVEGDEAGLQAQDLESMPRPARFVRPESYRPVTAVFTIAVAAARRVRVMAPSTPSGGPRIDHLGPAEATLGDTPLPSR